MWIISYLNYEGDVPDMILSDMGLEGGLEGTSPKIDFFETRKHSSNLLYNPIDENFLFTAGSQPNVLVVVNDLMAACRDDCGYSFITASSELV